APPRRERVGRPRRPAARGGPEPAAGGPALRRAHAGRGRADPGHRDAPHPPVLGARLAMSALGVTARWLHLAAGLGLVGLATATLLVGHRDRPTVLAWEARMLRGARALAGLVLVTGLVTLAHQSAVVTGRAAAALEIGEWVRLLGHSQFGTVWLVRHGVLLLLAALLLLREREESAADRLALRGEAWALAGVGAAAMAWAGHAA